MKPFDFLFLSGFFEWFLNHSFSFMFKWFLFGFEWFVFRVLSLVLIGCYHLKMIMRCDLIGQYLRSFPPSHREEFLKSQQCGTTGSVCLRFLNKKSIEMNHNKSSCSENITSISSTQCCVFDSLISGGGGTTVLFGV